MAPVDLMDSPGLATMCRAAVGGVFLVFGLAKLRRPSAFVEGAVEWDLLPAAVVRPLARALPIVEIVLGAALLLGVAVREAAVAIQHLHSGIAVVEDDEQRTLGTLFEARYEPFIYVTDREGRITIRAVTNSLLELQDAIDGYGHLQMTAWTSVKHDSDPG